MKKHDVLELIRDLPEDLDIDALIHTLWVRRKIERALEEAGDDDGIPHEDLVRESKAWRD